MPGGIPTESRRPIRVTRQTTDAALDGKHIVKPQRLPQPGEILDFFAERPGVIGQVGHVDRSGRDARQNGGPKIGKSFRNPAQHARLIGRSRSAAAESQS